VDGHCDCVISHLQYSLLGYQKASHFLADWVRQHRKKLLFMGGGGFVHPMLGQAWGVQLAEFAGMDVLLHVQEDADHCTAPLERRTAEEVENYLREHVAFFEKKAGLPQKNSH
jgi:acetoin utilization deacetylase AcuC-like enzyme